MKLIKILTAASLLLGGAAFAATAPAAAPAAAAPAAAMPAKADHHCRDQANEQKLKGAARKSFIKKCRADATAAK
jgi:Spy/CpxP family protein refolding chaperone